MVEYPPPRMSREEAYRAEWACIQGAFFDIISCRVPRKRKKTDDALSSRFKQSRFCLSCAASRKNLREGRILFAWREVRAACAFGRGHLDGKAGVVRMKTVLYLQASLNVQNLCELAGVREFARACGWRLVVKSVGNAASEKRAGLVPRRAVRIADIVADVAPDGVLVEGGALAANYTLADFKSLPTVFLDRCNLPDQADAVCVRSDSLRVAEAAFGELARMGYADYAYVPWATPLEWSESRGAAFRELVEQNGGRMHSFPSVWRGRANGTFNSFMRNIRKFLSRLPRPCGIFAANDIVGECVLEAAAALGCSVPREFALVGVDNDRNVCENTSPTLSSIMLDFRRAGICAGEALEALLQGRRPQGNLLFGVSEVVHRQSTRKFRRNDPRIASALEYVRQHVCEGLQVVDVVRHMDCSRRLAEMRFREITGHSILTCIRRERRALAERLLRETDIPIADVAQACGYAHTNSFRKDFSALTGQSPRQYRKSSGTQHS